MTAPRGVVPDQTITVTSPAEYESRWTAVVPIEWEQQRAEVRRAIVYHRWAALKVRLLARQQNAINHAQAAGAGVVSWFRQHQRQFIRVILVSTLLYWLTVAGFRLVKADFLTRVFTRVSR